MSVKESNLMHEATTRSIIGSFYYVFNYLGPGFLESVYAAALTKVLRRKVIELKEKFWWMSGLKASESPFSDSICW